MEILLKPILTEKMNIKGDKLNQYGFIVNKNANKLLIKKAVEQMYNVTVDSVNTLRSAGKYKVKYTKKGVVAGRKNAVKKAIITLQGGDKIDFYSNI